MDISVLIDTCLNIWEALVSATTPIAELLTREYYFPVVPILGINIPTGCTLFEFAFGVGLPLVLGYAVFKFLLPT